MESDIFNWVWIYGFIGNLGRSYIITKTRFSRLETITRAILTALRVIIALFLSLLWTVPVGVAIGRNPRLAQTLQPLVQIVASVPATALFPSYYYF